MKSWHNLKGSTPNSIPSSVYYHRKGDRDSAYRYLQLVTEKQDYNEAAQAEQALFKHDKFTQHNLDENYLNKITHALKSFLQVKKAYLVQKVLQHRTDQPLYMLLLVEAKKPLSQTEKQQLLHKIELPETADVCILFWKEFNHKLRKRIKKQESSLIYG